MLQLLRTSFTRKTSTYFALFLSVFFCLQKGRAYGQTAYYSKATGNLDLVSTWGTNTDGSGSSPADFTSDLQQFHIANSNPGTFSSTWTVSGASSKIIVDGADFTVLPTQTVTATIDVNAGRTLTLKSASLPALGALAATSTVVYSGLAFTSSFVIPTGVTYGNITFDNTSVAAPASANTITFAGNFTLTNGASFAGSNVTGIGYNLTTTGTANQTISGNGLTLSVWNLSNNNTVPKTGTLTLAANTNMSIFNSIIMNCTGAANTFSDGGNTLTTYNNVSMGGDALGYNLTGTIKPSSTASGTLKFRGFSGGAASDAAPIAAALNNVTINTGGTVGVSFLPASGGTVTIKGNLTVTTSGTGNVALNSNTINIGGNITHTPSANTLNTAGSTVVLNGTNNQTLSSGVSAGLSFNNLTVSNPAGITLSSPVAVSGTLTLTTGVVNTGANTLSITSTGSVLNGSTSSYINGTLSKAMPSAGTTNMFYEVGDVTYAPVMVSFSSSQNSGSVAVKSTTGPHPQAAGALLLSTNMANRYWTVTSTGVAPANVSLELSYAMSDLTGGSVSNAGYFLRKYSSGSWVTIPSVTNTTSATIPFQPFATTATGITGSSFSGDYAVGAPACNTISGGNIVATPAAICVSGSSSLSLVGSTSGAGVTFQWQSSPDGAVWTDISGETNTTYNTGTITDTMFYRNSITCQITGNIGLSPAIAVDVDAMPLAISGSSTVCQGSGLILSDATTGGAWSSSNTSVATIGSGTGIVTATSGGPATISYTVGGCTVTKDITVNPISPISGTFTVCQGQTTTLSDAVTGGTWTSADNAIATIGSSDGVVTGIVANTVNVTYSLSTGCTAMTTITVNPLAASTGTMVVCQGFTTALSNPNTGGTWTSGNTGIATVGASSGVVTGVAQGNVDITYTAPGGCVTSDVVTVNPLAQIGGPSAVCEGQTITLTNANSGGTWTSGATLIATINPTTGVVGGILAGTANITYELPTGCTAYTTVTVNPRAPITGTLSVCEGGTTTLSNINPGGTWISGAPVFASVGFTNGVVSANSVGFASVVYTLPTGCSSGVVIAVKQAPALIGNNTPICNGTSATLTDGVAGGTWTSSDATIATVDPSTGMVTGVLAGNATITYTLSDGCNTTAEVTINVIPDAIGGTVAICNGLSAALTNGVTGGTWSSTDITVATIGSSDGVVNTVAPGTSIIIYTLGDGCSAAQEVTVNALPDAIVGVPEICVNATETLTDATTGGAWSSSNTAILTVGTAGNITGVTDGTATITYMLPTTCIATQEITVNPLPNVYNVTGGGSYCAGGAGLPVGLDNTDAGIRYELFNGTTTTGIIMTGLGAATLDFGAQTDAGVYTVQATNINTSCTKGMAGAATITVVPLVTPSVTFVGGVHDSVCSGHPATFTAVPVNGGTAPVYQWSVNSVIAASTTNTYTYTPTNGDIVSVTLTSSQMCATPVSGSDTHTITVVESQTPFVSINSLPGNLVCAGTVVTFSATAINAGTAPAFTWYKNGVTTGVASTGTYTLLPTDGDSIYVKVHSNYMCPTTNDVPSNSIEVGVYPVYLPVVSLDARPGFFIAPNQTDTLIATVADGGPSVTYQWSINGVNVPGATNATFIHTFSNNDSVSCYVQSGSPCGRSSFNAAFMHVSSLYVHPISNTQAEITLFPNPNNGTFSIKGIVNAADDEPVYVEIVTMTGQMVSRKETHAKGQTIDEVITVSKDLASGMYLLNVRTANDNTVFHFMVQQ